MKTTPNHGLSYVEGNDKPADYPLISQENMTKLDTLIQQLIDGKAPLSHNHSIGQIMGLTEDLAAKADQQATATALAGKASSSHTHTMDGITGLTAALAAKANQAAVDTALAQKANTSHTHTQGDITGLTAALAGKAPTTHTHTQGDITGLTAALAGKAAQATLDTRVPSALALRLDTTVGTRIFAGSTMIHGDTGLRTLVAWATDGTLTYGQFPIGLTFKPGSAGGVWIRRVNDIVSLYISGAKLTTVAPRITNVPAGFYPSGGPYPAVKMSSSSGTISVNVGGGTLYMSGVVDENIPVSSGPYVGFTQWQVATSWPTALPGIPG